ncbi:MULTISPECIES: 16S rRNA (uracil(1498)-N(3))-methyltransferase [unclassified Rhizobacter]|uniref:16S rRNA (uracil(1498)-N(3))-methyltransferase n=1 Tax=unclassified Rhizobacter TaxID=2640088 RepID=UPI0006F9F3D1|nr:MULTISPECIES: 16S rRNA (uracil(1498)-N(3))-methyltransferase [unclassified Rhizobacter]KQU76812.1 16S rRNA methyltransferase [Rhizobacter sp. Root29]KQV97332.1 16S rRNA methyltransferase [Rhizobacter sp. Root1238]KRB10004.1 16S rRNA methyltransferase [Rhizobacter sp. Root16D2]
MPPRFHVAAPMQAGLELSLPPGAARHVQVLRLQPGDPLTLFNGDGGEWQAEVVRMGRSEVGVRLNAYVAIDRELPIQVTLALGMPANERMDALVEKATELGVAAIQPLMTERSVLRLSGERADKKQAHWQGVAAAASEQCGRTRVPVIAPVRGLAEWLRGLPPAAGRRFVLSLRTPEPLQAEAGGALTFLSGPEGGLSEAEEAAAAAAGFVPASLGPRVLRADTAPLAVLAHLGLSSGG